MAGMERLELPSPGLKNLSRDRFAFIPVANMLVAESGVSPDDLLVMSQPSLIPAPSPHQEHAVRFELTMTGFADRRLANLATRAERLELRAGIEPALSPWHGDVIPLDQRSRRSLTQISNINQSETSKSQISNFKYFKL
jgi:hypothetical protein